MTIIFLWRTLADHIHNSYQNNDLLIPLKNCTIDDLQKLTKNNQFDIRNLKLNDRELQIYNNYILVSYFNYYIAYDMYSYNLYMNDTDKNVLRNNIINNYNGDVALLYNNDLLNKLQLTDKEYNHVINTIIFSCDAYNICILLRSYYKILSDKHKNNILRTLMIYQDEAKRCLYSLDIPIEFRMQIFNTVFTEKDYPEIFQYCYRNSCDNNNAIHIKVFNNLLKNKDFSFFKNYLHLVNDKELEVICHSFYEQIFNTKIKFNDFYQYCITFGLWLRKSERAYLIQKLKVKSRTDKIDQALAAINFTINEIDSLNAIKLANNL